MKVENTLNEMIESFNEATGQPELKKVVLCGLGFFDKFEDKITRVSKFGSTKFFIDDTEVIFSKVIKDDWAYVMKLEQLKDFEQVLNQNK